MAYRQWAAGTKAIVWAGVGVGVGGLGYVGYRLVERSKASATSSSSTSSTTSSSTPPTSSQPSSSGTTFTVGTLYLATRAVQVGDPLQIRGTISPTLTSSGAVLTFTDQTGTTLATVSQGTTIAVNVTEATQGAYQISWTLTENGTTLAQSSTPMTGYWIDPTSASALATFGGNQLALQDYLAAFPYQAGLQTVSNALSYAIQNTLAGTEFGFTVAGLQHSVSNGIVTNTVLPIPSGASVSYVSKGSDPVTAGYELVGKVVNGQLWQVYAQPSSSSGSGSSGSSGSGSSGSSGSSGTAAQLAQLQTEVNTLTSQIATAQQTLKGLQTQASGYPSTISQLQSQLATLKQQGG